VKGIKHVGNAETDYTQTLSQVAGSWRYIALAHMFNRRHSTTGGGGMNQLERKLDKDIQQYCPEKGLKKIAVAKAAEAHFARAKDATRLYEAIERKLREQADYIIWSDGTVKHGGKQDRGASILPKSDPGNDIAHLWRKKLCSKDASNRTTVDKGKMKEALEDAHGRCVRICEQQKAHTRGTEGTGKVEWYTPADIMGLVRQVFGGKIDLDPASSDLAQETVQAEIYYTKPVNGLTKEWFGRVFLNPPYEKPIIPQFIEKLLAERRAGRIIAAILLTHNYSDTTWFQAAGAIADALCLPQGRIRFYEPEGGLANPSQGQAFLYFGADVKLFCSVFANLGLVYVPPGSTFK
jgi:phage N-6-adenine-methyltransferase